MIIRSINIEKFRAFQQVSFTLGKRITAISGRNATQKTTVLGMIGQPFTISKGHPMYGCKTIDGYNFRSQFKEKFKLSEEHDVIGEHKWTLKLHPNVHINQYFSVESIARHQHGKKPTLRFWNAESRARGAGYIQLPVYFLSLSRLFPIGESGKTKSIKPELTEEELTYCVDNYRNILSIQNISGIPSVGLEKGTSSKTFSGISDGVHDIFTNSAGEGDITKIILAILSFKRLKDQYGKSYKGGVLLIDELDATLYGFSQKKLVDYLWESAKDFKIQIVFTTHSPIILKQVNKYQRKERAEKGTNLPSYAYDSSIVYLEPEYEADGTRRIIPRNIFSSSELDIALNDINLVIPTNRSKLNIYCEDARAISFAQYILSKALQINLELYMNFVDINLGWTNYVQLFEKKIPEFINNMILLDGDVPKTKEYKSSKRKILLTADNFLTLPLTIEKDFFRLLKDHATFNKFQKDYSKIQSLNYDICFNNWPHEPEFYNKDPLEYKKWFQNLEKILGGQEVLYSFWYNEYQKERDDFVNKFVKTFNLLADRAEMDLLPPQHPVGGLNE